MGDAEQLAATIDKMGYDLLGLDHILYMELDPNSSCDTCTSGCNKKCTACKDGCNQGPS